MSLSRLLVKLLAGMPVALAGAGDGRTMASHGLLAGVAPTHRPGAFTFPRGADMRSAFSFLLGSATLRLLLLGSPQAVAITPRVVVFRGACFLQRDGYRLPAAFDLAGLASAAALQFAVLECITLPVMRF